MSYTKKEKAQIIEYLKQDTNNRIRRLEEECLKIAQESETKILRRLNNVSATLWNVKVKDVLMIERSHKPSIKHLISDIKAVQQESSFLSHNNSNLTSSDANRTTRLPLRSVSDSRVGKPSSQRPRTASSHR